MKKIGFSVNTDEKKHEVKTLVPMLEETPVKSVVYVRFDDGKEYPYYNDKFNLKVGNFVFVDGKLQGKLGRVTKVLTKFKVSTKYYKNVLRKLDTNFHGKFKKSASFMLAKEDIELDFEMIDNWFIPPVVLKDDEEPEEFLCGEGYEFNISDITNGDEIDQYEYDEAIDILCDNGVKAIAFIDGCGHAVVKRNKVHTVDFMIEDGKIKDIYCDCITPDFCRHSLAVCVAIKTLFDNKDINDGDDFFALDINVFNQFMQEVTV